MPTGADKDRIRLDKFLWAARFYKTRALASEAISGGKVTVNEQRVKPSREIHPGDRLTLRQGDEEKTVIVRELSIRRGPAASAAMLYEETPESAERRAKSRELRILENTARPQYENRPNKHQRRQIIRFKSKLG